MVCTHRDKSAVGTISAKVEHYLEWKDAYPFTEEQIVAGGNLDALRVPSKVLGVSDMSAVYAVAQNQVEANSQ